MFYTSMIVITRDYSSRVCPRNIVKKEYWISLPDVFVDSFFSESQMRKKALDLESVTAKHLEKVCLATNHPDYWYNASFFVFFNHRTVVGKISLFLQISPFHNYMYLFFYLTNTGFFRSIRYCKFLNSAIQPFLIK